MTPRLRRDFRRDAVGALLDPAERFGIDRGTAANPLHDGVQVCQDLRVDAGAFGFGGAHTGIGQGMASLSKGSDTPSAASVRCATCPRPYSSLFARSGFGEALREIGNLQGRGSGCNQEKAAFSQEK